MRKIAGNINYKHINSLLKRVKKINAVFFSLNCVFPRGWAFGRFVRPTAIFYLNIIKFNCFCLEIVTPFFKINSKENKTLGRIPF